MEKAKEVQYIFSFIHYERDKFKETFKSAPESRHINERPKKSSKLFCEWILRKKFHDFLLSESKYGIGGELGFQDI